MVKLSCSTYSQLSLNGHLYKTDTSIRRTSDVGPAPVVIHLFAVTKLPIRRTPLLDGQLDPVPTVSVLERVDCSLDCSLFFNLYCINSPWNL